MEVDCADTRTQKRGNNTSWTESRLLWGVTLIGKCVTLVTVAGLMEIGAAGSTASSFIPSLKQWAAAGCGSWDKRIRQTEELFSTGKEKSHKLGSLHHNLISAWEREEFKTAPASPCCTLQSKLRPAAGHRSAVSPPPTLPPSSGPTGLKQQMRKNPNPIYAKWWKQLILN